MLNEIGNYDRYVMVAGEELQLSIKADGNWKSEANAISSDSSATSFQEKGDFVTPIFDAPTDMWQITHTGESNFVVWYHSSSGSDLLVNEIEDYEGQVIFDASTGDAGFIEITADGEWKIEPME